MNITEKDSVAEVVVQNIKTAHIFKKHGIDFCCGGGISVEKACKKNNVDFDLLKRELETIDIELDEEFNFDSMNLSVLIDHIVSVHHIYVEENIPLLQEYADKVARVHGHHYKEVVEIKILFDAVAKELAGHLKKEEIILFPFIKRMVLAKEQGAKVLAPHFGTINNPIKMMESEHETAGDIFKVIEKLTANYTPPEGACNTFKALYSKLQEFEQDLHQHIHLENNILFPKAIELEKEV